MIKLIRLLVLCLIPLQSYSFVNIDSLIQVAEVVRGEEKAEIYLKLTRSLQRSDLKKSQLYAEKGIAISKEMKLQKLEANFLMNLGIIQSMKSKYSIAKEYYLKSIDVFRLIGNAKGVGYCYNNLGLDSKNIGDYKVAKERYDQALTVFELLNDTTTALLIQGNIASIDYLQGDFDSALSTYTEMLEVAKVSNKEILISRSYGNIGQVFFNKANYPEALNHFYKSIEIAAKIDAKEIHASALNGVGLIFSKFKMHDEAIGSYKKALAIYELMKSKKGMGMVHNSLASRYLAQDSILKAEHHIEKALGIYNEIGVKSIGNLLINLANIQIEKEQYKVAEETLNRSIKVAQDRNQDGVLAACYSVLGRLYLETQEYEKAKKHLRQAEKLYKKTGKLYGLHAVVERFLEYYKAIGDSKNTILYHEKDNLLRDSIYGFDQTQKIIRLELERQRNQFLQPISKEVKARKNTFPVWLLLIFAIIGSGGLLYMHRKKQYQKELEKKLTIANTQKLTIEDSLKQKNLETTFLSLDLSRKDEFLKKIRRSLESAVKQDPANKDVVKLLHSVQVQDLKVEAWDQFKQAYEQVFPNFFDDLIRDYPSLSTKELRHCALIRLKIPIQEISEIFGVSINSIHKARQRLRTKFSMTREDNLEIFISKYDI